jgi:hypothetical protein
MAIFTARVYRTNDGRYVSHGHPDAAFLAFAPGTEIGDTQAERWGVTEWVRMGPRPASMVMNSRGDVVAVSPITGRVRTPTGTIPPGHATASQPGVPAEVAPPVVAVADVVSTTAEPAPEVVVVKPKPATTTSTPNTPSRAGKTPGRPSREV